MLVISSSWSLRCQQQTAQQKHNIAHATDHHHCSHPYSTIVKGRLHMVHTLQQFLCDALVSVQPTVVTTASLQMVLPSQATCCKCKAPKVQCPAFEYCDHVHYTSALLCLCGLLLECPPKPRSKRVVTATASRVAVLFIQEGVIGEPLRGWRSVASGGFTVKVLPHKWR